MNTTNGCFPIHPDESPQVPPVRCAHGECPCECARCCDIWMEYQIAMVSLHDSEELSHENWCEITHLRNYVDYLERLLNVNGIEHCDEFEALDHSTQQLP